MRSTDADDKRARFEALALPLMTPLYNVALRLTGHREDAADAVQDTFYRAYRTFDGFRPGTNARAWMFTILYSVVINRRKKAQHEAQDVSIDLLPQISAAQPDARRSEPAGVEEPEVEAALRSLPHAFREAVVLVDLEDLSYEDAAAVVGCPVGTLRSRLFRGRRLLAEALREYAHRVGHLRRTQ